MKDEIALADKKIPQLYELKGLYPQQREMIDESLEQWQRLRKSLNFTLNNIYAKVERAYVENLHPYLDIEFIELLLKTELLRADSIPKAPGASIDSEAALTTSDLEPYWSMIKATVRMY